MMVTPELGLLDLSNEILFEIFIRVPYDQLQNICQTCSQTKQICADWDFWNRKAQLDFGITSEKFNTIQEPDGRKRYLQIKRDASELQIYKFFLYDMFLLGTYLKEIHGSSTPQTFQSVDLATNFSKALNENPDLRALPMMIYCVSNIFSIGCTIEEFHNRLMSNVYNDLLIIGDTYTTTANYYLQTKIGIDIQRCINIIRRHLNL